MVKQSPGKSKKLLFVVLGLFLIGATTTIVLNGTTILQTFGTSAYVPNPLAFSTYTEVTVGSNATQNASNFLKFSELYPIQEADALLDTNKKNNIEIKNDWGASKGNQHIASYALTVTKSGAPNYRFIWIHNDTGTPLFHAATDSHYDFNTPYFELNMGMGTPWGVYLKTSKLGNNQANCTKSYLKRYENELLNADGSTNNEKFWFLTIQPAKLAYPKRPGTFYVSNPVCFVPFETFEKRSFAKMVDTRYDKTKKAADYAFQTGTYVIAIFNHPAQSQYLFEKMYFTDNNQAFGNFTQKYCAIKGSIDPIHCTKSLSGTYRGIDIMKDGRLYNLAAFEQVAFMPTKVSLSPSTANAIVGGPFAFQWWQQTLGSKDKYWDYDGVNAAGNDIEHFVPQQATAWKVSVMK